MAPKRDSQGRFTEDDGFNLSDMSLSELFNLNKYFTRKTNSETKAAGRSD